MTPEQRQRASLAVRARMNELSLTVPKLASVAGVSQATVRALLDGSRWPRDATRQQIARGLRWPPGELARRADSKPELSEFTTLELLLEVCHRLRKADSVTTSDNLAQNA